MQKIYLYSWLEIDESTEMRTSSVSFKRIIYTEFESQSVNIVLDHVSEADQF